MKQLLFLLLFPCLAVAQYTGNAGQKITLGEQTSADGLVFRGLAADTTRKPSVDTMAFILLDTNTNIIWQYKKATNNAWTRIGGSISSGVTGTLPVANGGTGSATKNFVDLTTNQSIGGAKTFTSTLNLTNEDGFNINNTNGKIIGGGTTAGRFFFNNTDLSSYFVIYGSAHATNAHDIVYVTNTSNIFNFNNDGNFGVGIGAPTEKLHVVGNARITGAYSVTTASAANVFVTTDGVLQRSTSSIKYKTDVEDYSKGLKEVLQLRPVTFKSINSNNDKTYAGFIAEELADLKLNELVENNDSGEPDAISYAYMVTLLTKAIQEQQQQIESLKKRLLTLENK